MSITEKLYLLFEQDKLVLINQAQQLHFINANMIEAIDSLTSYKIADIGNVEYFTAEINQQLNWSTPIELLTMRQALQLLGDEFFPIISKAFQIIHWDKQHQFCSVCGTKTIYQAKNWEKHCPQCHTIFYPRIAPSIIVLIKKGQQILMARGPHFPQGVYGLIAGFVEPGENLEQAVEREVAEEIGINIKNIQYYGSQSWPFPNTLMVGFIAEYESGDIKIDPAEIESAGWFDIDQLPGLPSSTFSISSKMIQSLFLK